MWPPKDFPVCGGPGDYVCQQRVEMPPHWFTKKGRRYFYVDACIGNEIVFLLSKGIRTIECCCGHGHNDTAYIAVDKASVKMMKEFGYKEPENVPEEIKGTVFLPEQEIVHIGPERKNAETK